MFQLLFYRALCQPRLGHCGWISAKCKQQEATPHHTHHTHRDACAAILPGHQDACHERVQPWSTEGSTPRQGKGTTTTGTDQQGDNQLTGEFSDPYCIHLHTALVWSKTMDGRVHYINSGVEMTPTQGSPQLYKGVAETNLQVSSLFKLFIIHTCMMLSQPCQC